jgi:hypothetical protein
MAQAEGYGDGSETDMSAGRQAWLMLPEKTRVSLIESIGNAMKTTLETEEREVELLGNSMEDEARRIKE